MLESGYIVLSLITAVMLITGYQKAMQQRSVTKQIIIRNTGLAALLLSLWFMYTYFVSKTGILLDFSFPPKFPLLLVVPAFIIVGVVAYQLNKSALLEIIPLSWMTFYQSFRVVIELLFIGAVTAGVLHPEVTMEGYNYDMLFGFSRYTWSKSSTTTVQK